MSKTTQPVELSPMFSLATARESRLKISCSDFIPRSTQQPSPCRLPIDAGVIIIGPTTNLEARTEKGARDRAGQWWLCRHKPIADGENGADKASECEACPDNRWGGPLRHPDGEKK